MTMKITNKQVQKTLRLLDEIIKEYKENTVEKKRDWRTYEQKLQERIKHAVKAFSPLIDEAIACIRLTKVEKRGNNPKLTLKQKVRLLLIKRLVDKSNREMSSMLTLFSLLSDTDVSYKIIERLYSDDLVYMVLHNLHQLILRKKKVNSVNGSGDGTGYSLTIKQHYASEAQRLKDMVKNHKKAKSRYKKKQFVYSFALMDLDTRMYVVYGTSLKSEQQAYNQTMKMLEPLGIELDSLRLDKYYSRQKYVKEIEDKFGNVKIYLIPKKNATIRGSQLWKSILRDLVNNPHKFLEEYFQRNQSESGYGEDKRRLGWGIPQRREDRIDTAYFCNVVWHNLFWLKD